MIQRRLLVIGGLTVLVTACSLSSLGGLSGGSVSSAAEDGGPSADGNAEAASVDVGAAGDVDVGGDASQPLLPGGDFEGSGPGCGEGWIGTRVTLTRQNENAHSGVSSCRICESAPDEFSAVDIYVKNSAFRIDAPVAGERYVADGWIRLASGAVTGAAELVFVVQETDGERDVTGSGISPTSSWARLSVSFTVQPTTESITLELTAQVDNNACLELDDVTVIRVP